MCRPTHYSIAYEINPWMSLKRKPNHLRALRQWEALYQLLSVQLGAHVKLLTPRRGLPDLVFTANAGLFAKGRVLIRSNFRHPERQGEEALVESYAKRSRWQIIHLPRRFTFEGEGDALWMGDTLVFGFHFRSDAPIHEHLSRILKTEVLPIELADRRFYHLDTCFCPMNRECALWFPRAFDRYGRKVLERLVPDLIAVSERDAKRFACNAVLVGRSVVMQTGCSSTLQRALEQRGFNIHPVDLSEFLKSGGSAKCLVLRME